MEYTKQQKEVLGIIERLEVSIERLKHTISTGWFHEGYVENCKSDIVSYENQINNLKQKHSLCQQEKY